MEYGDKFAVIAEQLRAFQQCSDYHTRSATQPGGHHSHPELYEQFHAARRVAARVCRHWGGTSLTMGIRLAQCR